MSVIFESKIKADNEGGWYIELKDTLDDKVITCQNVEEYEKKVMELSEEYGGHVDEVKWSQDEDLSPHLLDEVRFEMAKMQEKYKEEIEKANKK